MSYVLLIINATISSSNLSILNLDKSGLNMIQVKLSDLESVIIGSDLTDMFLEKICL
jgi:hypothetical protein